MGGPTSTRGRNSRCGLIVISPSSFKHIIPCRHEEKRTTRLSRQPFDRPPPTTRRLRSLFVPTLTRAVDTAERVGSQHVDRAVKTKYYSRAAPCGYNTSDTRKSSQRRGSRCYIFLDDLCTTVFWSLMFSSCWVTGTWPGYSYYN